MRLREEELRDIYGIEVKAASLAALVEAQKRRAADFDADMESRKAELEEEIATSRTVWEKEKAVVEEKLREAKTAEDKDRKRRAEEFDYSFTRECKQKKDKFADELLLMEKDIAARRAEFERETSTKEAELSDRDAKIADREKTMDSLQAQAAAFPKELDSQIAKAVKETTTRLAAQAEAQEKLLKAEFNGERNVLLARIQAFESLVKSQEKQLDAMAGKVESAYANVQDIAVKAVDGSSKQVRNIVLPPSSKEDMK